MQKPCGVQYFKNFLFNNFFKNVSKDKFPLLMKKLEDENGFSGKNAQMGFEESGLYPFNREKITFEKLQLGTAFIEPNDSDDEQTTTNKQANCLRTPSNDVLKSIENIFTSTTRAVGIDMTNSVAKMFQKEYANKNSNNEKMI